jgi:4,5-dihydroxyphthalate decarboxylase
VRSGSSSRCHWYWRPTRKWRTGGQEEPGRDERTPLKLGGNIDLQPILAGKTLSRMLTDGQLDAVFSARELSCFVNRAPHVGLMFPNYRQAEMAHYTRSGIFPIMHLIGVRKSLAERSPWLPATVYKAFCQAKNCAIGPVAYHTTNASPDRQRLAMGEMTRDAF